MFADIFTELPDRIISQCGLVSGLLVAAVVYLAVQLAKTRAGWEQDRANMMNVIRAHEASYTNMAASHAKLEGMLLTLRQQ